MGEKKNRNRARIKFLVHDLGIEKFKELVWEERRTLPPDPRWTQYLEDAHQLQEEPLHPPGEAPSGTSQDFQRWVKTNVRPQRQEGFSTVTATLPLGDITASQLRALADIVRRFTCETIRTTVEQNFLIRWVSNRDLEDIYEALNAVGLGEPGAGTIVDIVTCPGTDTCKLGISSSRGLAAELRNRLAQKSFEMDAAVQNLHIKISGCFNSCGQHHVADLGFYGVSRKMAGYAVPHFQVVLGGEWESNADSYGLPIVAVPSKNIPRVVTRLTDRYVANRQSGESFKDFVKRIGKVEIKNLLEDLTRLPPDDGGPSVFSDWGDPREYSLGDLTVGECAGEVVAAIEFDLAAAECEVFDAQLDLEKGNFQQAARVAYLAMIHAAKALVKLELRDVPDDPDRIVREFTARFYDTRKFFDSFAGGKFAQYLFAAHASSTQPASPDSARYLIDEAQLFIDASHACYNRLGTVSVA